MRSVVLGVVGVLGGSLVLAFPVLADPDWTAEPTYETVDLAAGFLPDPWRRELSAGGATAVDRSLAPQCAGYIHAEAPDVDLNYESGGSDLFIHVESKADTSLIINAPDGRWYCNDDFASLDPMVVFHNPHSGNYNIWVGVIGGTDLEKAELRISELNPLDWN